MLRCTRSWSPTVCQGSWAPLTWVLAFLFIYIKTVPFIYSGMQ